MPGSTVGFRANGGTGSGYLALPSAGTGPGLVILQEWWGLVPHITALADRFAESGFAALAPDLYHGETPANRDDAGKLFMALNIAHAGADMRGAADYLLSLDAVTSKQVGILGFCMGGQLALYAGMEYPDRFAAVVDFYGIHPKVEIDPSRLRVPVLGHFATRDTSVPSDHARQLTNAVNGAGGVVHLPFLRSRPRLLQRFAPRGLLGRMRGVGLEPDVDILAGGGAMRRHSALGTRHSATGGRDHLALTWIVAGVATLFVLGADLRAQGVRYQRLLIKNALVIDGAGNPTRGPVDITIEESTIVSILESSAREGGGSALAGAAPAGKPDRIIDAAGMYVLPGIIDVHSHIQFSRAGRAMPKDYVYKLLLAHGITTIRDPGSTEGIDTMVAHARASAENRITAPTIIPYAMISANTPADARRQVREAKQKGAKGLKVFIVRPDVWAAISDEARTLDLPIATDLKIQETDALAATRYGVRSIEHWYGIPDAAIPGPQDFPDYYDYDNELDRFRWAGDLWRQADPVRLSAVLDTMLAHGVTWDPTFAIYEANRDLQRARTQAWFAEYALPQVMANFEPECDAAWVVFLRLDDRR